MNKVTELKTHVELEKKKKDAAETEAFNSELDAVEVTPEIRAEIEERYSGKQVEVVVESESGTARTSLSQYLGEITNFRTRLSAVAGMKEKNLEDAMGKLRKDLSLITPSIEKSNGSLIEDAKAARDVKVLEDCKAENITLEQLNDLIEETFENIRKVMKVEKLSSASIMKFLQKKSPAEIMEIIPKLYFECFMPDYEKKAKIFPIKFKTEIEVFLSYQFTTGPEMDDLQKFIEDENHTMDIFMKLSAISFDFTDAISSSDPKDVIERFIRAHPDVNASYKIGEFDFYPDKIQRIAAQKTYGFSIIKERYIEFREEYLNDPVALDVIDKEIANCQYIIDTIHESYNVEIFLKYLKTYVPTIKMDQKYIQGIINSAYQQASKLPIKIPFPGYVGNEKTHGEAAKNLESYMKRTYMTYNEAIEGMGENRPEALEFDDLKIFGHSIMMLIAIERYIYKTKKHKDVKEVAYKIANTMTAISSLIGDVHSVKKIYDTFEEVIGTVK